MIFKKINCFLTLILTLIALISCTSCLHSNVTEATCTSPGKCIDCGKEFSKPTGHDIIETNKESFCANCDYKLIRIYFKNVDGLHDESFKIDSTNLVIYKEYEPNSAIELPTPFKGNLEFIKWQIIELNNEVLAELIDYIEGLSVTGNCVVEAVYKTEIIPVHKHVACETCGLCISLDCDGNQEERCNCSFIEEKYFTVSYYDYNTMTFIGTEQVKNGECIDGYVGDYCVIGDFYSNNILNFAWNSPITSDISLYASFYKLDNSHTYHDVYTSPIDTLSPFQWKDSSEQNIQSYTISHLYSIDYNKDGDGFVYEPVMASGDPIDVTSLYSTDNKYGIQGKQTGYAFRIPLNRYATWENGEQITADDYIYSMKALFDKDFNNYRIINYDNIYGLDIYYNDGFAFANDIYDKTKTDYEGLYFDASCVELFGQLLPFTNMHNLADYVYYFSDGYNNNYYDYLCSFSGENRVPMNDEIFNIMKAMITEGPLNEYFNWEDINVTDYTVALYESDFPWEDAGIKKIDDYTIDIIYKEPLIGFYIKSSIGLPLVNETLYEKCKKYDEINKCWTSDYGTSIDTYMSYGPYKLTKFEKNNYIILERNDNWFGYSEKFEQEYGSFISEFDGKLHRQYETDKIIMRYYVNRDELFLKGICDSTYITSANYEKYQHNDRLYKINDYNFFAILLSDYDLLVAREAILNGTTYDEKTYGSVEKTFNKTILSIKEFRQALFIGLDRTRLVNNVTNGVANSLFSDSYIADLTNSIPFNSFDIKKEAVCEFWGVEYGEDKEYKTLDEAYESITGFDLSKAKELIDIAVDKAISNGWMTSDTIVQIDLNFNFGSRNYSETVESLFYELFEGTKLEGKFNLVLQDVYGDYSHDLKEGLYDIFFEMGWGGSYYDPYNLIQVFVDAVYEEEKNQIDKWINRDTAEYNITLNVDLGDGIKEHTFTVFEWYQILNGLYTAPEGQISYDATYIKELEGIVSLETRVKILVACEQRILMDYTYYPITKGNITAVLSNKINYDECIFEKFQLQINLRYVTYNYSDIEWSEIIRNSESTSK